MILLDITSQTNEDDIHSNNYLTIKLTNKYDIIIILLYFIFLQ